MLKLYHGCYNLARAAQLLTAGGVEGAQVRRTWEVRRTYELRTPRRKRGKPDETGSTSNGGCRT